VEIQIGVPHFSLLLGEVGLRESLRQRSKTFAEIELVIALAPACAYDATERLEDE
jgi:hypothetical protein